MQGGRQVHVCVCVRVCVCTYRAIGTGAEMARASDDRGGVV